MSVTKDSIQSAVDTALQGAVSLKDHDDPLSDSEQAEVLNAVLGAIQDHAENVNPNIVQTPSIKFK